MRKLLSTLKTVLRGRAMPMVWCVTLKMRDGRRIGFTEHNRDVTADGIVCRSMPGMKLSQISERFGAEAPSTTMETAFSASGIARRDIRLGVMDEAEADLWWVNTKTGDHILAASGRTGEISRATTLAEVEIRPITAALTATPGRRFQRTCDAELGDARCGYSLKPLTGTVTSVVNPVRLHLATIGSRADGTYAHGYLRFTSGRNHVPNFNLKFRIKSQTGQYIDLYSPLPETAFTGDAYQLFAGCDKTIDTCLNKFNNAVNFRGFPHIPGPDLLRTYSSPDPKGKTYDARQQLRLLSIGDLISVHEKKLRSERPVP